MEAMQTMMDGMADMEMTGDPARDFALMMIPHHQSAIDMAESLSRARRRPELTQLANEIIAEQRREIEFLENWLREQERVIGAGSERPQSRSGGSGSSLRIDFRFS
jgi:uncharacterized protein (DUF305 family)